VVLKLAIERRTFIDLSTVRDARGDLFGSQQGEGEVLVVALPLWPRTGYVWLFFPESRPVEAHFHGLPLPE
jgi:hypothetical protein